jgi:hypothetical protein
MEENNEDNQKRHLGNFLKEFKNLIYEGHLIITDRIKNRQSLIELGLTERQREEELLSLSVDNYSFGPEKDRYRPGDYWVFGKIVEGKEIFIRIKIGTDKHTEYAICYSFHLAERPLQYPLRSEKNK